MESLISQLDEAEIVKHLTPVEARLYRSSDRFEQLKVVNNSRWATTISLLVQGATDLGHSPGKILGE